MNSSASPSLSAPAGPPSSAAPLHLAVDAHRLVCEPLTSGATYLRTLLSEWSASSNPPRMDLLVPFQPPPELSREVPYTNPQIRFLYPSRPVNPIAAYRAQLAWQQRTIPALLRKTPPQVYFSPFHLTPQFPRAVKMVTTIHDLCWLFEPRFSLGSIVHRAQLWSACLRACRLICVSEFTQELLGRWSARFARKARVVHNGLENPTLDESVAGERVRALDPQLTAQEYLLWIGSPSPRKNLPLLFAVFKSHHERFPNHKLVIVAPPHAHGELRGLARMHNVEAVLRLFDSVDNTTRDALYRCARALIFPSICEGFGYPILEAMFQGCPPFAYQDGPAREMVQNVIPLATGLTLEAFQQAMETYFAFGVAERQRRQTELIARAQLFSARDMAARTLEVLVEAARS